MIIGTSPEGIRYAVRRSSSPAAYCALTIGRGTRDEEGFPSGTTHFTEHAIFKGTRHRRSWNINSCLERLGGELNAFTTKEEIVIHATVLKEDLRRALTLLSELALEPTFPEDEIEVEKGVVIDEIQSYKDSPADDIYDCFESYLFAGHPLDGQILGNENSVRSITSGHLHDFVKKGFLPERMAVSMVADLPEDNMVSLILSVCAKAFSGKTFSGMQPRSLRTPAALRFERREDKGNHEANAIIGGYAPSLADGKARLAAGLLANILAGPASNSILGSILREKNGWVYGVEASYTPYADSGVMAVSLGCEPANLGKCLRTVRKEISRLQDAPLSPRRLAAAKKQLLGQMAISSANGESQCLGIGKSMLVYGNVLSDEQIKERILDISADDLLGVVRSVFNPEQTSTLVFL